MMWWVILSASLTIVATVALWPKAPEAPKPPDFEFISGGGFTVCFKKPDDPSQQECRDFPQGVRVRLYPPEDGWRRP